MTPANRTDANGAMAFPSPQDRGVYLINGEEYVPANLPGWRYVRVEALGTALFIRYGSIKEGEYRPIGEWMGDAEAILELMSGRGGKGANSMTSDE